MSDDIHEQLTFSVRLSELRREARIVSTGSEAEALDDIRRAYAAMREEEKQRFRSEFTTRTEAETKRLIDEAGSMTWEHTPGWSGRDRFDKTQIARQADRNVRQHHEHTLRRIDRGETEALETLIGRATEDRRIKRLAKDDFTRTVEPRMRRRVGPSQD